MDVDSIITRHAVCMTDTINAARSSYCCLRSDRFHWSRSFRINNRVFRYKKDHHKKTVVTAVTYWTRQSHRYSVSLWLVQKLPWDADTLLPRHSHKHHFTLYNLLSRTTCPSCSLLLPLMSVQQWLSPPPSLPPFRCWLSTHTHTQTHTHTKKKTETGESNSQIQKQLNNDNKNANEWRNTWRNSQRQSLLFYFMSL